MSPFSIFLLSRQFSTLNPRVFFASCIFAVFSGSLSGRGKCVNTLDLLGNSFDSTTVNSIPSQKPPKLLVVAFRQSLVTSLAHKIQSTPPLNIVLRVWTGLLPCPLPCIIFVLSCNCSSWIMIFSWLCRHPRHLIRNLSCTLLRCFSLSLFCDFTTGALLVLIITQHMKINIFVSVLRVKDANCCKLKKIYPLPQNIL